MKKSLPLITALLLLSSFSLSHANDNMVKNSTLDLADGATSPSGWKNYDKKQKFSQDDKEAPKGTDHSLRVDLIADGGKSLGQIVQKISVKAKTDYIFTLDVKSTKSGIGLGQIKLMSLRSELERIPTDTSGTSWETIELKFNSGNADNVLVVLRYKQKADLIGESIWFANPVLTEAQ